VESASQRDLFESPKALVPASDLCASNHKGADTSTEAFQSTPDSVRASQRKSILEYIKTQSLRGCTCDEIEVALQLSHQGASARCTELLALELIFYGIDRRPTRAGKSARVYRHFLLKTD
jgi:hypothetical protein